MKIQFGNMGVKDIVSSLDKALDGRALKDLVHIKAEAESIIVTISKLGTSTLTFVRKGSGDKAVFELGSEKIAFSHRAFKDEVKSKLKGVVEKAGGTVID